jgi:hypothetical protein
MSDGYGDGLSKIELKAGAYGRSFAVSEEAEDHGLLGTAPDPGNMAQEDEEAGVAASNAKSYDDKDLLPVMIENGLDKIGVL